jgi:phthiocerol/phenolphthiocerol synthesis type-I polyketide synthase E
VNTELKDWKNDRYPLRAGVSSFGIGGTNAHVVLEEWPAAQSAGRTAQSVERTAQDVPEARRGGSPCPPPKLREHEPLCPPTTLRSQQLILLSAKTGTALERMTQNLVNHLKQDFSILPGPGNPGNPVNPVKNPGINLADAGYTMQVGRKALPHRRMLVCSTVNETIEALTTPGLGNVHSYILKHEPSSVVFMFSGQGTQYVNMGLELYRSEPVFREEVDRCIEILKPLTGYDIKEILYPSPVPPVSLWLKIVLTSTKPKSHSRCSLSLNMPWPNY